MIEGMGELHLEIIVDRLRREWKVECDVGAPQVRAGPPVVLLFSGVRACWAQRLQPSCESKVGGAGGISGASWGLGQAVERQAQGPQAAATALRLFISRLACLPVCPFCRAFTPNCIAHTVAPHPRLPSGELPRGHLPQRRDPLRAQEAVGRQRPVC